MGHPPPTREVAIDLINDDGQGSPHDRDLNDFDRWHEEELQE
jgi:hypothetical protein